MYFQTEQNLGNLCTYNVKGETVWLDFNSFLILSFYTLQLKTKPCDTSNTNSFKK